MTATPPFPYFGGKRRVAYVVWAALGDVATYCEPFAGGAAVLLGRPSWHRRGEWHEVLSDLDGHITNAWRAIQADPEGVWAHANRPHSEHDLTAWRAELTRGYPGLVKRLEADPRWCDVEAAGVWVWGKCVAVGTDWSGAVRPVVGSATGVRAATGDGRGLLGAVSARLAGVTLLRGDWSRAVRHAASMWRTNQPAGGIGYFLDPPYASDRETTYAHDCREVAHDVRQWALDAGTRPEVRIVLCGYGDEHAELERHGWRTYNWKATGGYGNQADGRGRENAGQERLWLSPHCLPLDEERQGRLFE